MLTHRTLTSLLLPSSIHESDENEEDLESITWPYNVELISLRHLNESVFGIIFRKLEYDLNVVHKDDYIVNTDICTALSVLSNSYRAKMYFTNLAFTNVIEEVNINNVYEKLKKPWEIISIMFVKQDNAKIY